jgi:hypothetical protein
MLNIQKNHLKAALSCASKKDLRFYLMGVLLECASNGDLHIVGCDGYTLFAGLVRAQNINWTGEAKPGPWKMIIPADAIKQALKSDKNDFLTLTLVGTDTYQLGNSTVFKPIDGSFPDWRRVSQWPNAEPAPGQYNAELVLQASQAVSLWFNYGTKSFPHLHQFGSSSGVMTGENMTGFAIIMPLRASTSDIRPFTPATY